MLILANGFSHSIHKTREVGSQKHKNIRELVPKMQGIQGDGFVFKPCRIMEGDHVALCNATTWALI